MTRLAAALLSCALAVPAGAYQREEHYYSTRLALAASRPGPEDAVVSLCAQLADEAPELNPIEAYRRMMRRPLVYAWWSLRSAGADEPVGRMITVQQALHALTGGSSEAAHAIGATAARAALKTAAAAPDEPEARADAYCALGFALHFYGDTYAHRRVHNPARMYPTGLGHLFDGLSPDLPLYNKDRAALWDGYLASFAGLLPGYDFKKLEPFCVQCAAIRASAHDGNAHGRRQLRQAESAELKRLGAAPAPLERNPGTLRCQDIVDDYAAKHGLKTAPNCESAWTLYRTQMETAFDDYERGPDEARAPARALRHAFYRGPLFDGGAK